MAKKPPKPQPVEDPDQSRRFLKLVADLEAAGEIDPTEADAAFERLVGKVIPPKSAGQTEES